MVSYFTKYNPLPDSIIFIKKIKSAETRQKFLNMDSRQFIFSLIFVLVSLAIIDVKGCTVLKDINGCTVPFKLDIPLKDDFTPACNNHDVCYRCGERYGWSQQVCDTSFRNQMISICDNLHPSSLQTKKFKRGILDFIKKAKETVTKFKEGWEKATQNRSGTEEAKRLLGELKDVSKLIFKWFFISDKNESCKKGAEIYYRMVKAFGIYRYRVNSKSYCSESCAKKLGQPFY